jgi:hypothetical protein
MASLDSLPPDQRAVLSLVLQRGRSFDDIARILSIDRAAVRGRALAAVDALGPQTEIASEHKSLIADYLLGQLPPRVADQVRERLASNAGERAWARVRAAELASIAGHPLPGIPSEQEPVQSASVAEAHPIDGASRAGPRETPDQPEFVRSEPSRESPAGAPGHGPPDPKPRDQRPRSRVGGALVLGGLSLVAIAVVVVAVVVSSSGGTSKHSSSTSARQAASAPTSSSAVATTTSSTTATRVVAEINLLSPRAHSKAVGIAEVLKQGTKSGIAIVAQGLAPNSTHPPNAYAVWLYNSPADSLILGFVNPGVGSSGRLQTEGPLPTNAGHYKQVLLTLETRADPHAPGKVVLRGMLTGLS